MRNIRISVRGLVEFILRSGDIDNRRTSSSDEAMQAGSRMHRLIQSRMGSEYRAEYPLTYEYDTDKCHVVIEGRADGIFKTQGEYSYCIDEIKGTYRDIYRIDKPDDVHLAQAKCYAAIYSMEEELETIGVRMTYVNLETEELRYFDVSFTASEISEWFYNLLSELTKWVDDYETWVEGRQESIQNLEFPYQYRDGQKELVSHVYNTVYHGKRLFIEAPTGTGKTLSTLFPAVRSVGAGRGDKIFYLTARTIARTVAEESIGILKEHGLKYRNITLTAKEKICFSEKITECNPDACPYAKGHFDRINACLYEMITTLDNFDRRTIEEYAHKHQVCPFELALDLSLFADLIIGDYNYVFDPNAYLRRFFGEGRDGDYLFLIDEAHNLVDRGREMYSAILVKEDLLACQEACQEYFPPISRAIERCNQDMLELKRQREQAPDYTLCVIPGLGKLVTDVEQLYDHLNKYLADRNDGPEHDTFLDMYFKLSDFLNIYDLMGDDYMIYTAFTDAGEFYVKLFNVDPARNLSDCMDRARSCILFSATLLPIQYYKSLLGGRADDYEVYARSIFDPGKRLLVQASDVSSKYTSRNHSQYIRIARYIHEISQAHEGNYMVFAPSYSFMYEVYEAYIDEFYNPESEEVLCQSSQMGESAKEEFLQRFRDNQAEDSSEELGELFGMINCDIEIENKTLIGFCVLGGVFSEGIDLKDDALIGVIVIGTGLPQIGGERDLLKEYFDARRYDGFDYAYRFPGMNRVQQAAGRLIRTESDTGIIALLDDRYSQFANKRLFPREWSDLRVVNVNTVAEQVRNFWEQTK